MPITLRHLAERRGEVTINYYGDEVHIYYKVDAITKEFRAESLRIQREGLRIQRRQEELLATVRNVSAEDGSPEAAQQDADAEKAIQQLQVDDVLLKKQIDTMTTILVDEWDVLQDDGKMLPITMEALFPIPAEFESAVLRAVMDATRGAEPGEAQAATNMSDSPSGSKPKDV